MAETKKTKKGENGENDGGKPALKAIRTYASDLAEAMGGTAPKREGTEIRPGPEESEVDETGKEPAAETGRGKILNELEKEEEKEFLAPPPPPPSIPAGKIAEEIKKLNESKEEVGMEVEKLEEEFRKEVGSPAADKIEAKPAKTGTRSKDLKGKNRELEEAKKKIEEEIKKLEIDVKEKLSKLRETKRGIEEEINRIKNLEMTKDKIEEEMEKIRELERARQKIEEEIKTLEGGLTSLKI